VCTAGAYGREAKQRGLADLRAQLDGARAELANAPTAERLGFPQDIVERVKRYPDEKKKHAEAVRRVMEERDDAGLGMGGYRVPPVYSDSRFLASFAAGVAM